MTECGLSVAESFIDADTPDASARIKRIFRELDRQRICFAEQTEGVLVELSSALNRYSPGNRRIRRRPLPRPDTAPEIECFCNVPYLLAGQDSFMLNL